MDLEPLFPGLFLPTMMDRRLGIHATFDNKYPSEWKSNECNVFLVHDHLADAIPELLR